LCARNFPKHQEELPRQGDAYINRTIAAARRQHYEKGWITSPEGGWPRRRETAFRAATEDDLEPVLNLVRGQRVAEWIKEVQALGWSRSSAYRYKEGLGPYDLRHTAASFSSRPDGLSRKLRGNSATRPRFALPTTPT